MLRLNANTSALPFGLVGPGGITDYLDADDLPKRVGETRPIVVRGRRIGAMTRVRAIKKRGNRPILFDLPPEWRIVRANAGPENESGTSTKGVA